MLMQTEGSHAMADAVRLCRPAVISCYPITPQTHIVENLSTMVREGQLGQCSFLNVESEFAALSVLIGASAAGARCYTATSSQGLLFMAEAVFNASGMLLPIVMTIGNRAIGAPINIWNDHSDSMALRDSGWIQIHAESNQEAVDLHIQAFRLAETLSLPVMVCVDGFILTHAYERVDMPEQTQVDEFLPPFRPIQQLDPSAPVTIGAMVGPDYYAEVRYLLHQRMLAALDLIPQIQQQYERVIGRSAGGLCTGYRSDDATTLVVAMGSINGTIKDAIDDLRAEGHAVGSIKLSTYRPFPFAAVAAALANAQRVIVVEKNLATGQGGVVAMEVTHALKQSPRPLFNLVAGLGGRAILKKTLADHIRRIHNLPAADLTSPDYPIMLDLNPKAVTDGLAMIPHSI